MRMVRMVAKHPKPQDLDQQGCPRPPCLGTSLADAALNFDLRISAVSLMT